MTAFLASFPSPPQGVWHLGFIPIRAYALFIIAGIIVALVIGDRRWVARGGEPGVIYDIALWAVPFGLIGGRLYHVMTDWKTYFGDDGAGFIAALRIWDGGLGIWGAVALGGIGAWIGCRQRGIPLPAFGDAIAPGIVLAQAIGRLGNYFNQELYGRETAMPWGMKIYERRDSSGVIDYLNGVSTGHVEKVVQPTFLYELIWNVLVFVLLIYADRRFKLGHGRLFALYVASYCLGRFCVELLRDDTATHIAGVRINSFTSVFVFIGAVVYFILAPKGREDPSTLVGKPSEPKEKPKVVAATAATTKEEVPQKVGSAEDSALVEWTKELAAVAATSGVVAGVAVAAEHDEEGEPRGEGEPEPVGDADEAAEPLEDEEPESAEAGEEREPEAEAAEPEAEEEAGAEEAGQPEAEAAEGEAEAAEPEADAEEAGEPEAEPAPEPDGEDEAEAEAEEAAEPEDEAAEPEAEAEEVGGPEAEETAEPEAEEGGPEAETAEPEREEEAEAEEAGEPEAEAAEGEAEAAEPEAEAEEVAPEPEAAEGEAEEGEAEAEEAPEGEAAADQSDQDQTVDAEATPREEIGDTGASPSTDDLPEDAGTARRRWRLPRFRNRAK